MRKIILPAAVLAALCIAAPVSAAPTAVVSNVTQTSVTVTYSNLTPGTSYTDNLMSGGASLLSTPFTTASPPPPPPATCGGSPTAATWCDEFNGAAGSPPDSAKWQVSTRCENDSAAANYCLNAANARHDGAGNMVLKVTTGTKGRRFDGVDIATFAEGTGWPPAYTLASVRPHTWFEARMKFAGVVGDWAAQWPESVNPSFIELDVGENRLAVPNDAGFHVHGPLNADRSCVADIRQWHTYAADYFGNRVTFYLDEQPCGTSVAFPSGFTAPAVGMQLEAKVANDNSWGSGGQPVAPHPASEDVLTVDYVRAWQY